eukprot:Seg3848.3 transcript_id=Seg3848.3/GoldUCD/mRNA.D3Y31 product="Carbonic anhydrase 7" protein_id=Seg3848.3/GoldUCD/D3Y31
MRVPVIEQMIWTRQFVAAGGRCLGLLRSSKQSRSVVKLNSLCKMASQQTQSLCSVNGSQGANQSPINIESHKAIYDKDLAKNPLKFGLHSSTIALTNTGASVDVKAQQSYEISGGPLPNPYELVGFHFHWQNKYNHLAGSEHTIDGKAFASELHLVHLNKAKYNSVSDALGHKNGLCVLGVFLELTSGATGHNDLEALTRNFEKIQLKDAEFKSPDPFCPYGLLPADQLSYWTYPGSLTTSPFSECVTWIVFKEPIQVSQSQINQFRLLKTATVEEAAGKEHAELPCICHNVRETFPLGDRVLRASFS